MQEVTDIEIFDRAVWEYLSEITNNVIYAPTNIAVQTITKNAKNKDDIPLSFISFYRDPNFDIDMDRSNFTAATLGDMIRLREDTMTKKRDAMYVQHLPVNLTYQIDIWAAKEKSVQQLAIALISKLHMENQVLIADMEPKGEPARFHITNTEWTDNSDLETENEKGRRYRHTITITIAAVIKLIRKVATTEFCAIPVDIYENT